MSHAGRPVIISWTSDRKCLRCGRDIEPGSAATVTRGGLAWLHPVCATLNCARGVKP
jgi:hypothetical protein